MRTNKNNGLNVTLDIILDLDLERPDRKGDSEPSPRLETICSDSDEDEENNHLNVTVNPQSKVTKPTKPK